MDRPITNMTPSRNITPTRQRPSSCWIPRTPLTKSSNRKGHGHGCPRTMPRLTSASPMIHRQRVLGSVRRNLAYPSSGDRFIPNRAKMNMALCQASIVTAEKRRVESIGKAAARQRRKLSNSDDETSSPQQTQQAEPETRLQAEFHRRMKAALFDIPLERAETQRHSPGVSSSQGSSSKENSSGTLQSIIAPNLSGNTRRNHEDLSYLAYASLSELEAEDVDAGTPNQRHSSEGSLMSFSSSDRGGHANFSSNSSLPSHDPYDHDVIHVLQRSAAKASYGSLVGDDPSSNSIQSGAKIGRRIPTAPTRILDAPDLVDDYYLNLISWSVDNVLAVALGHSVYLWNANNGSIQHLVTLEGRHDYITSVSWSTIPGQSKYIGVGTSHNAVQVWDTESLTRVRTLSGHCARVSALAWNHQWLSSGGRDSTVLQHDIRASSHIAAKFKGHTQEVCGLKWNEDGSSLASGGNENYLCIWDAAMSPRNANRSNDSSNHSKPRLLLTQHKAAVKALAWCPFRRDLLASGGGTADRTIKFWNSNNGTVLNSVDTGSQVCSILWSKHQKELVSSHGFSENQLILWQYPTMSKVKEFRGHTARVLNMEMGPEGQIVSAAADETLRFWDIFGPPPNRRVSKFGIGDVQVGLSTIR